MKLTGSLLDSRLQSLAFTLCIALCAAGSYSCRAAASVHHMVQTPEGSAAGITERVNHDEGAQKWTPWLDWLWCQIERGSDAVRMCVVC
jgi:hypothetical protein